MATERYVTQKINILGSAILLCAALGLYLPFEITRYLGITILIISVFLYKKNIITQVDSNA